MAHEEAFETLQSVHSSSYSEEDLVSDLIGFYMYVNGMKENAKDNDAS